MRIAVLGGGTAGFIAAAHLTRHLPQAELLHVFDSRIPTIGVGKYDPAVHDLVRRGNWPRASSSGGALRRNHKEGSRYEGGDVPEPTSCTASNRYG